MEPAKPINTVASPEVVSAPAEQPLAPGLPARLLAPGTGMLRALRLRDYRLFWTGNFLSNIGTWMHHVALGWLVLALALALGVSFNVMNYAAVAAIAFLLGTTSAVNFPAFQAMVRDLSSREDLLNAIALNSMQFNASRFIGPAIAGILVGTVGLAICFYINAASYLAPLVALWMVHYRAEVPAGNASLGAGLKEGFDYLRTHPRIFLLVGFVGMISLFGLPYLIFLPVFARDVLHVGATGLGYLFSASGGGALAGAVVLAGWRPEWRRVPLVLGGMLFFFGGVLTLALSTNFYLSLAALAVVGAAMVAAVATINSLLQTVVPDEVRGRVLGWHSMAYLGFSPIGSLLIGVLADVWSTPAALAVSAALPLVLTLILFFKLPWLRQLQ